MKPIESLIDVTVLVKVHVKLLFFYLFSLAQDFFPVSIFVVLRTGNRDFHKTRRVKMAVPLLAMLQMRLDKMGKPAFYCLKGPIIVGNNHHAVLLQGLAATSAKSTFATELMQSVLSSMCISFPSNFNMSLCCNLDFNRVIIVSEKLEAIIMGFPCLLTEKEPQF